MTANGTRASDLTVVEVHKRKLGGPSMRWRAYVVDRDAHGCWLFTPRGSIVVGERDGVRATSFVGVPDAPGLDVLHLAPGGDWWFAAWAVDARGPRLTVDVCRPPVRRSEGWSFDDLELDLWWRGGDDGGIADRDEFDEAVAAGQISDREATASLEAAHRLEVALREGVAPFGNAPWERLDRITRLGLQPLRAP